MTYIEHQTCALRQRMDQWKRDRAYILEIGDRVSVKRVPQLERQIAQAMDLIEFLEASQIQKAPW